MGVNSIMNDAGRIGFVIRGDYSATETYDFLDIVYYNNATYVAKKNTVGNAPQNNNEFWQVLLDGEVGFNDIAPTFLQAKTRENINSGEKLPVLFGKIKKWYTDLKAVAFSGSYNDLSDTPSIPAAVAVKGNAESSYRTGNVNLTPANIGAVPTANVLDSKESITANTASGNVAGALGTKEINANLQSQIDTLNSNLNAMNPSNSTQLGILSSSDSLSIDPSQYKFVYFIFNGVYVTDTFSISAINKHYGIRRTYTVTDGYGFSIDPYIDTNNQLSVGLKMTGYTSGEVSVHAIK